MANESDYPARIVLESGAPDGYLLEDSSGIIIKELQNYYELVRLDGAVNFWPLSEASSASPAADLLGTNPGTYNNSPTMGQTGPLVGDTSTGILLNGSNQDVTVTTGSTAWTGESGALTREAWVKTTAASGVSWGFMASSWSTTVSGGVVSVRSTMQNTVAGQLFNQNGGLLEKRVFDTGGWLHIAMTVDVGATTARMYVNVDNIDESSPTLGTDFPTVTSFTGTPKIWDGSAGARIGSQSGSTFLTGSLALVAMYPTVLTADQIARHYRCGLQFLPDIPPPVQLAAH